MRIGAKKRPFYRVVAIDEQKKRNGSYLELLGTYNPLTEPKEIILKKDRIKVWTDQGAVLSDGFLRITGQAPKKPARKPKRDKPQAAESKTQTPTEARVEETPAETNQTEPSQDSQETEQATPTPSDTSLNSESSKPQETAE